MSVTVKSFFHLASAGWKTDGTSDRKLFNLSKHFDAVSKLNPAHKVHVSTAGSLVGASAEALVGIEVPAVARQLGAGIVSQKERVMCCKITLRCDAVYSWNKRFIKHSLDGRSKATLKKMNPGPGQTPKHVARVEKAAYRFMLILRKRLKSHPTIRHLILFYPTYQRSFGTGEVRYGVDQV
ncbi:uncharacterized protein V6R79_016611 [Siganus canaliculatus]